MDFEFWKNCWSRPSQPFHLKQTHHFLLQFYQQYFAGKEKVLLPLCGKSQDLLFLAQNNIHAVGVEFNPQAVLSFWQASQLEPETHHIAGKKCYRYNNIDLWQCDFFELSAKDTGAFDVIFDRAALIALPQELRYRYARHLQNFLRQDGVLLLVTVDYESNEMDGPPFYVSQDEIQQLFAEASIKELGRHSIIDSHPRWQELKLSRLDEVVYEIRIE